MGKFPLSCFDIWFRVSKLSTPSTTQKWAPVPVGPRLCLGANCCRFCLRVKPARTVNWLFSWFSPGSSDVPETAARWLSSSAARGPQDQKCPVFLTVLPPFRHLSEERLLCAGGDDQAAAGAARCGHAQVQHRHPEQRQPPPSAPR